MLEPDPEGEFETFWDELGHRSEARGSLGLLLGTPFIYGSGAIEITTRDDPTPTLSIGVGVVF